ncbi:MAG: DegT/DnrJ/EryC1/StrS family aminotransferase [Pseudomonadota bacterium]
MIAITKPIVGDREKELVVEVMNSGMLAQGPRVKELEEKFAALCGTKYAVATNSGTAAIHASLAAFGVGAGDEVITVPFTFIASVNPILMQNATPVFADIDEKTFNLDPEKLEEKITKKTKAIIPVCLYGQIYNYEKIKEIADKHNLFLLEDACQSVNAKRGDLMSGACGDMAAFSLYATKNIMSGEGGIVTTNSEELATKVMRFRHHGQGPDVRYFYHELGYNYRTTDLCASIALAQLERLEEVTNNRITNAKYLSECLGGLEGITIPHIDENCKHVFHQYTIKVDSEKVSRDEFLQKLRDGGIGAGVYYPKPIHLFPLYEKFGYKEGDFPVAEKMSQQVVSLPCHPSLSREDLDTIVKSVKDALK